jgi:O-antigen ligase
MSLWIGLNPVIKGFSEVSKDLEKEGARTRVWQDTCNLIKDYPTLGTGLGTYEYAYPKYKTISRQVLYDHTHNDYLELMSDTGITGVFIVIAGAAYYLFMVTRLWFQRRNSFVRSITIGCLGGITYIILHSLTDFNLHIPANALHLSIITGIMHKTITQL